MLGYPERKQQCTDYWLNTVRRSCHHLDLDLDCVFECGEQTLLRKAKSRFLTY